MEKKKEKGKNGSEQLEEEEKGSDWKKKWRKRIEKGKKVVIGEEREGFRVLLFKWRVKIKYENWGCRWVL